MPLLLSGYEEFALKLVSGGLSQVASSLDHRSMLQMLSAELKNA